MLDSSKLNAFEDNQLNVTQILKFVFERVEKIVGKGGNFFKRPFPLGLLKFGIIW